MDCLRQGRMVQQIVLPEIPLNDYHFIYETTEIYAIHCNDLCTFCIGSDWFTAHDLRHSPLPLVVLASRSRIRDSYCFGVHHTHSIRFQAYQQGVYSINHLRSQTPRPHHSAHRYPFRSSPRAPTLFGHHYGTWDIACKAST